ncbi:MAG: chromate resistance protein ChrB domain-containing protein [Phyllobacterium sp.]
MSRFISPSQLISLVGTQRCPRIVDVQREDVFRLQDRRIAGAVWRPHMDAAIWGPELAGETGIVVCCTQGHNVSEIAAALMKGQGLDVRILEGGIDAYTAGGGLTVAQNAQSVDPALLSPSVWATRARPKIDRIACPWLIRRFLDPDAVFHFVAPEWVKDVAEELNANPFDIEGVYYSHREEKCSFDTMIEEFGLNDPALHHLAQIVRAADTAKLKDEPQAHGLLALSLGLSAIEEDDLRQMEKGMVFYDALYGWCRFAQNETHNWPAGAVRQ